MSDPNRPAFLYKWEAACAGVLSQDASFAAPAVLKEHFEYIKRLHDVGDVVLFGLTVNADPSALGFCVFRANSKEAAQAVMKNDPFITKGVARGTLFPFHIAFQEPA